MKDLVIYGAGGFGREIACLINEINKFSGKDNSWNLLGFIDDGKQVGYKTEYGTVLGGLAFLNEHQHPLAVVLAIGSPFSMQRIISNLTNKKIFFPNIIALDIRYLDKENMSIGQGNIFFSKCSISCNVHIGSFNIFNSSIALGHDVKIGDYNVFMSGTRISGEVTIGNKNFFGIYSVVLQQNKIGKETVIASSSVVMKSTKDNSTYIGNPAKRLNY
jgi:sugar O-acyltransferase (sialic acid O-acetyltransferase NeuD family)